VAYEDKKRADSQARRRQREAEARARRIADLEARIAASEQAIRDLEAEMSSPAFYEDRSKADASISRHQSLMWEVGDLMHQWESLQADEAD
jgi:hypothetical protein